MSRIATASRGSYVMLPWSDGRDCSGLRKGLADAVFGVPRSASTPVQRLGAQFGDHPEGARVRSVTADGIAAAAGIRAGDVIVAAAGEVIAGPAGLLSIIRRQAPGTWLPLVVRRDGRLLDLVAEFPAHN
jgi:S1-C subfamily serine protease